MKSYSIRLMMLFGLLLAFGTVYAGEGVMRRVTKNSMIKPFIIGGVSNVEYAELEKAFEYWSSIIELDSTVYVLIDNNLKGSDKAMIAEVKYELDEDGQMFPAVLKYTGEKPRKVSGKTHPNSLDDAFGLLEQESDAEVDLPDRIIGFIHCNQNTAFRFENVRPLSGTVEYRTQIMRCLAQIMGFGTTIIGDRHNSPKLSGYSHSKFDSLLKSSDGTCLTDFNSSAGSTRKLLSFLNGKNGELYLELPSKRILVPYCNKLNTGESFFTTAEETSMMYNAMDSLSKISVPDATTLEALEVIGHRMQKLLPANIKFPDLDETNTVCAYTAHQVKLETLSDDVNDIEWELNLKNRNGSYIKVLHLNGNQITIPKIQNPDEYYITSETSDMTVGRIPGKLIVHYTEEGQRKSETIDMDFNLDARIKNVTVTEHEMSEDGYYDVDVTVDSFGASTTTLSVNVGAAVWSQVAKNSDTATFSVEVDAEVQTVLFIYVDDKYSLDSDFYQITFDPKPY